MEVSGFQQVFRQAQLGSGFYAGIAFWLCVTAAQYAVWVDAKAAPSADAWTETLRWEFPAVMMVIYLSFVKFVPPMVGAGIGGKRLQDFMLSYNFYQVIFNTTVVILMLDQVMIKHPQPLVGATRDTTKEGTELTFLVWLHYNNKYIEFFDTVFMILRGKSKQQVSFLHVYHHTIMPWVWIIVLKHLPGAGDHWFGAFCNTFVHICMYGYYFLTALKVACPWKKLLTKLQLVQFVAMCGHAAAMWYLDSTPGYMCAFQIFIQVQMILLFGNFYRNQYKAKKDAAVANKNSPDELKSDPKKEALLKKSS